MARHVRIRVSGGWYHVFSRGHNRERIFRCKGDYEHFLELLEGMREIHGIRAHAYCLMPNHYHLLVRTPEANVSRGIQWLNGSYAIWHNKAHDRMGHLFGERFKAILLENGARGLDVSVYIHMNPVATEAMGLGKKEKAVQRKGMGRPPSKEEVDKRLKGVREYPWSSYRGYAGYEKMAKWLDAGALLQRLGDRPDEQKSAYRKMFEDRIRRGVEEDLWSRVKWGLVLGGERFARKVRGRIVVSAESRGRRELGRRHEFDEIVRMVERIKKESWPVFRDRYGDWGRDLALWAGRRFCGMRLVELSEKVGGIGISAATLAVKRLERRSLKERNIRRAMQSIAKQCKL